MPPFDRAEYADRLRRVRERMSDQGLDVLIVSDPANMAYLTGYDGWSFYTPQGVAVGLDVDPVLFTRLMDANGARVTTYLDDDAILGFPDHYVQARDKHPLDWVAGELPKRGLGRGTDRGRERRLLLHAAGLPRARGGPGRRDAGRLRTSS